MKGVGWWMRHIQCIILHRALTFEKNSTARSMDAQISSTSSIDGSPGTVTCLGKHLSFPCSSLSIFFSLFLLFLFIGCLIFLVLVLDELGMYIEKTRCKLCFKGALKNSLCFILFNWIYFMILTSKIHGRYIKTCKD